MRGLLIVLCALVTAAAALAGGCAFLFTGLAALAAPRPGEAAGFLAITVPVLVVNVAVAVVNTFLIVALARGRAPRRSVWFLLLAVVDFAVAGFLVVAGLGGQGPFDPRNAASFFLPAFLALKGVLTLLLPPRSPPPLPPGGSTGGA